MGYNNLGLYHGPFLLGINDIGQIRTGKRPGDAFLIFSCPDSDSFSWLTGVMYTINRRNCIIVFKISVDKI